ncbi:hypothetical protein D3C86_1898700 [compost metagenome]
MGQVVQVRITQWVFPASRDIEPDAFRPLDLVGVSHRLLETEDDVEAISLVSR